MKIKIVILIFIIAIAINSGIVQAESDEGLVAEWHFDEGAGNIVKDSSGNRNDGTIYGATQVDGKYGKALSFDGKDDYINCGSITLDSSTFTYEVWIKTSDTSAQFIMVKDPSITVPK